MKKIITLLAVLVVALSALFIVSCKDNEEIESSSGSNVTSAESKSEISSESNTGSSESNTGSSESNISSSDSNTGSSESNTGSSDSSKKTNSTIVVNVNSVASGENNDIEIDVQQFFGDSSSSATSDNSSSGTSSVIKDSSSASDDLWTKDYKVSRYNTKK